VSLLQLGERDEIDRIVMLLHGDQGATALGFQRAFLEQHAAALALAEGRLDDAEARVARALEWAPDHPNIVRSASAQRWAIRLEQDGIDPHRLDVMSKSRPTPWLEALAALVHAEHGDLEAAAAALKVFATREDLGIPFNTGQAPTLRALAETAAHVGDAPFARALTPYVAPYTGQLFAAFFGHFCDGAADRALGQLALAQDDPDTAVAHLHAALALEDDFRAPALTARTRYWLALALGARNHAGDDEEAEREAASAARTAGSCGLVSIQHLVERLEHSDEPSVLCNGTPTERPGECGIHVPSSVVRPPRFPPTPPGVGDAAHRSCSASTVARTTRRTSTPCAPGSVSRSRRLARSPGPGGASSASRPTRNRAAVVEQQYGGTLIG
jgi:tetratricopeptide (TPR) repeat protein